MQIKVFSCDNREMALVYLKKEEENIKVIEDELKQIKKKFKNRVAICISGTDKFVDTIDLLIKSKNN